MTASDLMRARVLRDLERFGVTAGVRRRQMSRAARARKARRGWR